MQDALAHTRIHFHRERVIAGPTQFYAISRLNLAVGPIRNTIEDAEQDADNLYLIAEKSAPYILGWGVLNIPT